MTATVESIGRLGRASMLEAVGQLRTVSEGAGDDQRLPAARVAVRGAIRAVEEELGALTASDGLSGRAIDEEPRLFPAIERLEARLAAILVKLWEASAGVAQADFVALTKELQTLADQAMNLIHELYTSAPALD